MTDISQEETQQELFLEFADEPPKRDRFIPQHKINKPILMNTSVEQIILIGIALILVCCFVFFLGVLRGKSLGPNPAVLAPQRKIVAVKTAAPKVVAAVPGSFSRTPEVLNASKPYTIQVSTYRSQSLAEKEAAALRRSGYYSSVVSNTGLFEVRVGQYANAAEAKKDLKALSAKYKGCYLRRR